MSVLGTRDEAITSPTLVVGAIQTEELPGVEEPLCLRRVKECDTDGAAAGVRADDGTDVTDLDRP